MSSHVRLRECWLNADNRRQSCGRPGVFAREVHAVVVETIRVDKAHQRQGLCRAYLNTLCADPRFELVVVEGVRNPHLAAALMRWGWDCDPVVMDFYKQRQTDGR